MALIFQQPAGHKLEVDGESILQDIYQLVLNSVRLEAEIIEKMSLLHFAKFSLDHTQLSQLFTNWRKRKANSIAASCQYSYLLLTTMDQISDATSRFNRL